ncbi:MAG: Ig-like domain-containing protein [Desulfuromonadaceae bacterium]
MNIFKGFSKMWFLALLLVTFVAGCAENGAEVLPVAGGAPTVTSTTPANLATGVQINRRITATFSQEMNPATISITSFYVTGPSPSTAVVQGTYTYAGETAVFTPTSALATNSLYTATVTTSVKNTAGVAMIANHIWTFTTGLTGDTTAPTLFTTGAADGEIGLPINRDVTATFSEPMNPATLVNPATNFTLCSTGTVQGGPCLSSVVGEVTYLGNTATFNPSSDLLSDTWYKATVLAGANDLADNALVPGLRTNPWNWKTAAVADTTPPTVTTTNPADQATNVPVNNSINATFSEAMSLNSITTDNFKVNETGVIANVLGTVAYDVQNNIATFTPLNNLEPDTEYTVTVTNGAKDLAGNALVVPAVNGLPVPNPWTFTTAATIIPPPALAINLRGAESFGIAARSGLTSTGVTVVNGDVALYPLAGCTDSTGNAGASADCLVKIYSSPTGMTVNGSIYWAGDPFDNGGTANSVTNDLNIAWTEGMNKVDTLAGTLSGELGGPGPVGKILLPGVYHEPNLGFAAGTVATFDGLNDPNAVFIIKVGTIGGTGDLVDSGTLLLPTQIKLINGAQARNIWFVVGRDITIGSGTTWNGNILAGRDSTVKDGSTVYGRVLGGATGAGAIVLTGAASPSVTTISVPQ